MPAPDQAALFTDLYELTMLQSYVRDGMRKTAAFDLFVRRQRNRNYLVVCGLDSALSYLENLRFTPAQLQYLGTLPQFEPWFLDWLEAFRFTGDVYAMPEGSVAFANEPILEVVAPLPEAQLVETALLNCITYPTNVASKAARIVRAAGGRPVAEFGMRRLHGVDASLQAARAAYVGGVSSTSNVLAGFIFGIAVTGTMAHSYIQVHPSEAEAFRSFAGLYPETTLLVDTYDTLAGVRKVVELYHELPETQRFSWIRLDSGDLAALARGARRILDEGGLSDVRIIASGSLDEHSIERMVVDGAPIDAFGVGTRLGTVADMPYLDSVYKLVEYDGQPSMKLSEGKSNYPGRKQVFRAFEQGKAVRDVVATADESGPGEPLLKQVMDRGARTGAGRWSLDEARVRAQAAVDALPEELHALEPLERPYPVTISESLHALTAALKDRLEPS